MCRPVGCCPVRLSHSCLSLSWFVAQMTVHLNSCSAASVSSILSICPVGLIQTKTALSKPYRQHSTKGFTNIHFAIHFALALHQPYYRSAAITPLYAARCSPAPDHTRLTPAAPARACSMNVHDRQAAARSGRWRRLCRPCSDLNSQPKRPGNLDLWPFDLESGVRVTCDVGYLCANCSLPRSGRKTSDVRQHHRLMRHNNRCGLGLSVRNVGYCIEIEIRVSFIRLDHHARRWGQ